MPETIRADGVSPWYIRATFEAVLDDWTNESFDPFSAPQETGSPYQPRLRRRAAGAAGTAPRAPGESSWMREFVEIACCFVFASMWNLLAGYGGMARRPGSASAATRCSRSATSPA